MGGDSSLSRSINCYGKQIAITKNCHSALQSLRKRESKRVLWVDAVCVDQNHIAERNHQVNLMSNIYSNASQVLAFLGPRSLAKIDQLYGVLDYLDGTSTTLLQASKTVQRVDLAAFLDLRYFDRVWILQEIALAKLVVFVLGDCTINWTATTASILLKLCSSLNINPPSALEWLPATQPNGGDFLDALVRCRNCSVSCKPLQ